METLYLIQRELSMERFYRALHFTRIDPGVTIKELEEITLEVVKRNEPIRPQKGDYWVTQLSNPRDEQRRHGLRPRNSMCKMLPNYI